MSGGAVIRVFLGMLLVCGVLATGAQAQTALPCCSITAINAQTGVVSARVSATGAAFEFQVTDARLLPSLRVGQAVFANLTTKQVSLDGRNICCSIVQAVKPAAPALAAGLNTNLSLPACPTATSAAFLKVSGLQGESADACHKGEVELLSITANGNNFSIVKRLDRASPPLWLYRITGEIIPQATITLFTSGSGAKKVTYALKNAKITSLTMSAGPTSGAGTSTQEVIGLAAAEVVDLIEASTVSVQPATQPPPMQISMTLGGLTAEMKGAAAPSSSISLSALSAQIAGGGSSSSFVLSKAIDSASPQFQQAYLTKVPLASVVITIQRSSGNLTLKFTNALVTNDVQSSAGEQITLSPARLEIGI